MLEELARCGASGVPVALLNPYRGRTARASELDKAGLSAVWEVMSELEHLGFEHGIHRSDILRIASNQKQAKLWQKLDGVKVVKPEDIPKSLSCTFWWNFN